MKNKSLYLLFIFILLFGMLLSACTPSAAAPAEKPAAEAPAPVSAELQALIDAVQTEQAPCENGTVLKTSNDSDENSCIIASGIDWKLIFSVGEIGRVRGHLVFLYDSQGNRLTETYSNWVTPEDPNSQIYQAGVSGYFKIDAESTALDAEITYHQITGLEVSDNYRPTDMTCLSEDKLEISYLDSDQYPYEFFFGGAIPVEKGFIQSQMSPEGLIKLVAYNYEASADKVYDLTQEISLPSISDTLNGQYNDNGVDINITADYDHCGGKFYVTQLTTN